MIAVTGGAGFIGSHLVTKLLAAGESVRVIEKPGVDCSHLRSYSSPFQGGTGGGSDLPWRSRIEILFVDITNRNSIHGTLRGCDTVYHLAADPNLWEPRRGYFRKVNHLGTVNVLDAALAHGAKRILHCSTESILTRVKQTGPIREDQDVPLAEVIGPYCRSKWFAEKYAMTLAKAGAPIVIVNPTLPVGPGDRGLSPPTRMMLDFCKMGRKVYLDADLNLIDVRDVAEGMILAIERGEHGKRYLLGAENWSVKRVFDFLADQLGKPRPKYQVPYPVALLAAYISEFVADTITGKSPAATITGVNLTRRSMAFDASASLAALQLTPRPVTESILEAVAEFRQSGRL